MSHANKSPERERATVREHAASVYVERHVCAINSPSATERRVFKFNQTRRPKLTAAQATMKWPKYIQHVVSHRYRERERDTDTICSYRQRSIRTALACCTGPEEILLFDPLSFPFSPHPSEGVAYRRVAVTYTNKNIIIFSLAMHKSKLEAPYRFVPPNNKPVWV